MSFGAEGARSRRGAALGAIMPDPDFARESQTTLAAWPMISWRAFLSGRVKADAGGGRRPKIRWRASEETSGGPVSPLSFAALPFLRPPLCSAPPLFLLLLPVLAPRSRQSSSETAPSPVKAKQNKTPERECDRLAQLLRGRRPTAGAPSGRVGDTETAENVRVSHRNVCFENRRWRIEPQAYCRRIERTNMWGGQHELLALSHALRRNIVVFRHDMTQQHFPVPALSPPPPPTRPSEAQGQPGRRKPDALNTGLQRVCMC